MYCLSQVKGINSMFTVLFGWDFVISSIVSTILFVIFAFGLYFLLTGGRKEK
jgi:hypothetical protein